MMPYCWKEDTVSLKIEAARVAYPLSAKTGTIQSRGVAQYPPFCKEMEMIPLKKGCWTSKTC
jgi:hypothetical protein